MAARLVDADALNKKLEEIEQEPNYQHEGEDWRVGLCIAQTELQSAPTIEAEPVKHGRWVIITDEFDCEMMECSCCGAEFYDGDNDTVDCLHNYCPNCGAKMDGGAENE